MAAAEVAATGRAEMEIGNALTLIVGTPILLGEISAIVVTNQNQKVLEMVAAVMIDEEVVVEAAEMVAMEAEEIDEVEEAVSEEIEVAAEVASAVVDVVEEEAEDSVVDEEVEAGIVEVAETAVQGRTNLCR